MCRAGVEKLWSRDKKKKKNINSAFILTLIITSLILNLKAACCVITFDDVVSWLCTLCYLLP